MFRSKANGRVSDELHIPQGIEKIKEDGTAKKRGEEYQKPHLHATMDAVVTAETEALEIAISAKSHNGTTRHDLAAKRADKERLEMAYAEKAAECDGLENELDEMRKMIGN